VFLRTPNAKWRNTMRPNLSYTSETGKGADIGWETYSLKRKVTCILSDFTNFSNILVHVWYKSEYLGLQCKVKHVISSVARINYSISIKNYVHGISLIRHVILLALFSRSNTQPSIFKLIQNQPHCFDEIHFGPYFTYPFFLVYSVFALKYRLPSLMI